MSWRPGRGTQADSPRAEPSEVEQQRERWERLCHEAEQQRDDWERLCHEAEQQRDDWERLCHEAEQQRDELLREAQRARDGWSPLEFSLSFAGIDTCREEHAALAVRERVFLYGLVFALAPMRVLEVGTFKGGSARIISAALDDLKRGGELVTIDPSPEQIAIDWSSIAHNTRSVKGYFPWDFERSPELAALRFDLAFIDGDHGYDGVFEDLRRLPKFLLPDSYVLLHDASNAEVSKAIDRAIEECGYRDCGKVGRITNTSEGSLYGGLRLLWMPQGQEAPAAVPETALPG